MRKSSISMGDTIVDDAFDPALEWDGYANNTLDFIGSHESNGIETPISINSIPVKNLSLFLIIKSPLASVQKLYPIFDP